MFISACSISTCSICPLGEPVIADTELLTRFLPPHIKTLEFAGERLSEATNRLASAMFHLAETAAQSHGFHFGALERVRCDASVAQAIDEMAVPELFAAAGIDFGYESWSLSEATVPRGALLEWCRSWESSAVIPSVPMPLPPEDESDGDL